MIARTIALVVALTLGFALSQAPEIAQQYRQRLGGAVDELRRIVLRFDEDSARSGFDRAGALAVMERVLLQGGARAETEALALTAEAAVRAAIAESAIREV